MPPKQSTSATNGTAVPDKQKPSTVSTSSSDSAELDAFLAARGSEVQYLENGKIRCLVTGTDMPKRLDIVKVSKIATTATDSGV